METDEQTLEQTIDNNAYTSEENSKKITATLKKAGIKYITHFIREQDDVDGAWDVCERLQKEDSKYVISTYSAGDLEEIAKIININLKQTDNEEIDLLAKYILDNYK